MKIRLGFVSNSSSSSFVAVFTKVPKTANDVFNMMFNGKNESISIYDMDGLSTFDIANTVMSNLKSKKMKRATINEVAEIFMRRYHYYPAARNVSWGGKQTDSDGGAWMESDRRYFGSDPKLLEIIRQHYIKEQIDSDKYWEEEHRIMEKFNIPKVPYAYKDGKNAKGEPFTKAEILASKKYEQSMINFRKTDKEYLEHKETGRYDWDKYEQISKITMKLAKKDAKKFFDDNKGKFIFIQEYSDNDGNNGCIMEHGDIFINVEHIQVSNH
jgi:hypothetical protein